jgi:c-di-GMP-binding flagellar brake protein YcgR
VEVGKKSTVAIDECEWKDGIMIDLSGGGIRFVSGTREEIMSLIQVRFEIIEDGLIEAIYAYAKVLRSERTPNKSNVFDQRVEFFGMKRGMRERIIKYIFDTQRKSRVKESGME